MSGADAYEERGEDLWRPSNAGGGKAYRHLRIDWPNASIKKTLFIGATAAEASPPIYDRPRDEEEASTCASCVLTTKSSPINAIVHIAREVRTDACTPMPVQPVLVSAKTGGMGSISLGIPEYSGSRPLRIVAKSSNGNLTILLPTSFCGTLSWTSETGTLKLSPALQQRFKLIGPPHKHRGSAHIAPSTASGNRADSCHLTNHHGSITIKEFAEDTPSSKSCTIQ